MLACNRVCNVNISRADLLGRDALDLVEIGRERRTLLGMPLRGVVEHDLRVSEIGLDIGYCLATGGAIERRSNALIECRA